MLDSISLKIGPEPNEGEPDNRPPSVIGLRDRALIAVMVFSFARVTAAVEMKVADYYTEHGRSNFRLHEKGGKEHDMSAHHTAEAYNDANIDAAGIAENRESPLFLRLTATAT
jgi:integrase/recombinase XerD